MQEYFIQLAVQHAYLVYAIIIILACVEGPVLSMIFGVFIRLGLFPFWPVYFALMGGDLLGDAFWYHIGKYFGHAFVRKFGKYFSVTEENIAKLTAVFYKYKNSILFISKITTGFGFAIGTLITAGLAKIPFKRYILINFLGQFIWSGMLIAVGYYFSHLYIEFNNWLLRLSLFAFLAVLIAAFFGFRKYMREKLTG